MMRLGQQKKNILYRHQGGFTLVEMIAVIVITGIIASFTAMTLSGPVQQYLDSGLRAEMTSIADTATRFIIRDLRTALPNSVRTQGVCGGAGTTCFIEFLPTSGGGRYLSSADCSGTCTGDILDFGNPSGDTSFDVLGTIPAFTGGNYSVVVNNQVTLGQSAYEVPTTTTGSRTGLISNTTTNVVITPKQFPSQSPGDRFQIISTPVTYVCSIPAGGVGGTLTRYWGYAITNPQPTDLPTLTSVNPGAVLASNLSACGFSYVVTSPVVTVQMTISETDSAGTVEKINLSDSAYVANQP